MWRASPPSDEALSTDLLLALFGVPHSEMARRGFKRWWVRVVPAAVECCTYVVAACVVLAQMFRFREQIEALVVWEGEHRVGVVLLWSLFVAGWLQVLVSTFLINHFELFGLARVFVLLTRRAMPETGFRTPMLYRCVRHPLYVGLLLSFCAELLVGARDVGRAAALRARIQCLHPDRHRFRGTRPAAAFRRVLPTLPRRGRHVAAPTPAVVTGTGVFRQRTPWLAAWALKQDPAR